MHADLRLALLEARAKCGEDITLDAAYMQAHAAAYQAAAEAGLGRRPRLRPDVGVEPGVHRAAWRNFNRAAAGLCAAYGEDARLTLVTATCRDVPGIAWVVRMARVTKRRDDILASLNRHRVWQASFFDVHASGGGSGDFSPHWHIMFVTTAERQPDVLARLDAMRSVAISVVHCDRIGRDRKGGLRTDEERRWNWLRVLAYCCKGWKAPKWLRVPLEWEPVLLHIETETELTERTARQAVNARAAFTVNLQRGRFCKVDRKAKTLEPLLIRTVRPPRKPKGRPRKTLDPVVIAAVSDARISVKAAAKQLGVDRATVRLRISELQGART